MARRRSSPPMSSSLPPSLLLLVPTLIAFLGPPDVKATIFVPEEIPSLLSVIYSNMPPIKKGTDSRIGVGFRLGPNADVQFQLELGPQINTQPIGAAATAGMDAATKKRHATSALAAGAGPKEWLNKWRLQMSPGYVADDETAPAAATAATTAATGAKGPLDAVAHLRQLYKPQPMAAAA